MIYETSFEEYDESYEALNGKFSRFGNWRVNMPSHAPPFTHYDPAGVYTGLKSMHVFGEKAWIWGDAVRKQLPYGEQDALTGDWLVQGVNRALPNIKSIAYNAYLDEALTVPRTEIPDALFEDVIPSQYMRNHWEGDYTVYDPGAGYSWNPGAPLVEPRARIANNYVGSLTSAYQRIYFKPMVHTGCSMQILRQYGGSDYIARVQINPGNLRLLGYGRTWQPNPIVGDVDVSISMTMGAWHVIELGFVKGVNGRFQVWYGRADEPYNLLLDIPTDTSAAPDVTSIQTGMVDVFDHVYAQSNPYAAVDYYFDDWAIDNQPIGPLDVVKHNLSVNSNITGVPFDIRRIG